MGGSENVIQMIWVNIASFLSGLLGSMGFGGGSVLIIYLTLFASVEQVKAQGINLIFFIPCAVVSVIINLRKGLVKYREGLWLIIGGIFGVAFGYFLLKIIPKDALGRLFGGFLVLMGVYTLFKKSKAE